MEEKTKTENNNVSNETQIKEVADAGAVKNTKKKNLIILICGIVAAIIMIVFVLISYNNGWLAEWLTGGSGYYYSVGGQMVEEGGSVTLDVEKQVYKRDSIVEGKTVHQYGDYMGMECSNRDTYVSYSGFVIGDDIRCSMGFTRDSNNADINYMIGLEFEVEAPNGVEFQSVSMSKTMEEQYDISIEDNKVTIRKKDEFLYSGTNFGTWKFILVDFKTTDGFNGGEVVLKNLHLDTGGKNIVYGNGGAIASYDPDSISDIKNELPVSQDDVAYGIRSGDDENKLVFYANDNGKLTEIKVEDFGECSLHKQRDFRDEQTFVILKKCGSMQEMTDGKWIIYNYYGDRLAELSQVYFSTSEDLDVFVGRIDGTDEWKLFSIDGSVVRNVNPDDFVFRDTGVGKVLDNISEL